jgi:WD40 repeat protein
MRPAEPADSVVRVLGHTGTAGTGFLISTPARLIATCAHVVEFAGAGPERDITVVFHATGQRATAYVEPAYWRDSKAEDVAILRLRAAVPEGIDSVLLGTSTGSRDHPFRTFGFPRPKSVAGLAATGTITDRNPIGPAKLQLSNASEVAIGFSGAPLLDTAARRVVGMVVEILAPDDQGRFPMTAFGVPAETLVEICPELGVSDLCPYRELHAFNEDDAEFFFGRSDAVDRLLSVLRRDPRFLAVFGPSGSGKSSLVRAGLLPRLRANGVPDGDRWEVIITRPADLGGLESRAPGATTDAVGAARSWLSSHPGCTRLVLVIDQFEEIFVILEDDARVRFLASLSDAVRSTAPVTVILTMRDEFYSRFVREAPGLGRALEDGLRNVPAELTRKELTDIVEAPATLLGLRFEPELVNRIVNDAIEHYPGRDVDTASNTVLPLLELTLTQMWTRTADGVLSHAAYEPYRGLSGGIARWADEAMDRLGTAAEPVARQILTGLVHLGDESQGTPDSRQRRTLSSLCRRDAELPMLTAMVGRLADGRLVVTAEDSVELIHDALLREWGRLQDWLREDRRFLSWRQDMERQHVKWERSGPEGARDEGWLLHGHDLQIARDFRQSHAMAISDRQDAYVAESLAVWEREQRRLRDALTEAERQRAIAEAQLRAARLGEQAARVLTLLPLEPVAGLALAADAMIKNISELPGNLVSTVQVSLHAAVRQARERDAALGHTAPVTCIAVAPRGQYVVSASADRTIRRWSLDGQPIASPWTGHSDTVTAIAIDPAGQYVVSASADRTIRVWDRRGRLAHTPMIGNREAVCAVGITPDGRTIVSGGTDRSVRIWDRYGYGASGVLRGHTSDVNGVVLLDHDRRIVSSSADGTLREWSRAGESIGSPWLGHESFIYELAADPSGQRLASASADSTVRLWDAFAGAPLGPPVRGHRGPVNTVRFHPHGDLLASGGADSTVRLFRPDGTPVGEPLHGHDDEVWALAFAPDGRLLASAGFDGTIRLWPLDGGPPSEPLRGHQDKVWDLAFAPGGAWFASASADRTLRRWTVVDGTPLGEPLHGHEDEVCALAVSPDGQSILSGSADTTLRLWDDDGQPVSEPLTGHDGPVWGVAIGQDSRLLVSASADGTVRTWDGGWRAWLEGACGRLRGHPGPSGEYAAVAQAVREASEHRPWLAEVGGQREEATWISRR